MSMSKKDFVALADQIRYHNAHEPRKYPFGPDQIQTLANFCQSQNPDFNRERWLGYIAGTNGPSGGAR